MTQEQLIWRKIDPDNLPKDEEEVIFIYKGFCQMGYFSAIHESNMFTTTSGICADTIDVTHYILISDLLQLPKED